MFGGRGAQDLETASAGLSGGGFGQCRLTRPRGAGDHEQAARAARGTFQQAADLLQLTAPPGERHIPGIPPW